LLLLSELLLLLQLAGLLLLKLPLFQLLLLLLLAGLLLLKGAQA
jgi:hypothetical protein